MSIDRNKAAYFDLMFKYTNSARVFEVTLHDLISLELIERLA